MGFSRHQGGTVVGTDLVAGEGTDVWVEANSLVGAGKQLPTQD